MDERQPARGGRQLNNNNQKTEFITNKKEEPTTPFIISTKITILLFLNVTYTQIYIPLPSFLLSLSLSRFAFNQIRFDIHQKTYYARKSKQLHYNIIQCNNHTPPNGHQTHTYTKISCTNATVKICYTLKSSFLLHTKHTLFLSFLFPKKNSLPISLSLSHLSVSSSLSNT
jgi:hypothetical protein